MWKSQKHLLIVIDHRCSSLNHLLKSLNHSWTCYKCCIYLQMKLRWLRLLSCKVLICIIHWSTNTEDWEHFKYCQDSFSYKSCMEVSITKNEYNTTILLINTNLWKHKKIVNNITWKNKNVIDYSFIYIRRGYQLTW